jgi:8-oxo-dGTP diphosphatase
MKYRYCYHCGQLTTTRQVEGRTRSYCENCKVLLYENPIPSVAIVAVNHANQILLVRRSVEPGIGKWCLPGGFIEIGETPEQAIMRELKEEVGISLTKPSFLGVGSHLNGYYGDVIIIGFSAYVVDQVEIIPGDDVSEAAFFELDKRPGLIFRVHEDFISTWLKKGPRL